MSHNRRMGKYAWAMATVGAALVLVLLVGWAFAHSGGGMG